MNGILCANYTAQRQAFQNLLQPQSSVRILFFEGQSGLGKTWLVNTCAREKPGQVQHVAYTFRQGSDTSIAEVFFRAGDRIGWGRMAAFSQQMDAFQAGPEVQVNRNSLLGWQNSITLSLHAESLLERQEKQALLTRAWFTDLGHCPEPFLLIFDGYEKAPQEVQNWISGPFLDRVARQECLRVLVAGQRVPDPDTVEWAYCCERHLLPGIREARHWEPVIEAMGRYIPQTSPENARIWLAGVCHALGGKPGEIMKIIENLPFREDA